MSKKISELTAATDVTASDLFQVVDIEDPAMASSGTNKKVTAQTLGNYLPVRALGSTTSRTLSERFGDTVNVKDFGAAGDGIQDDTSAIQAWISYIVANKKIGVASSGTYKFTSSISASGSNWGIRGDGSGSTKFLYAGAATNIDLLVIGDGVVAVKNCAFVGFKVDSTIQMIGGVGIHFRQLCRSTVDDVVAAGQDGTGNLWHGVRFNGLDNVTYSNFEIKAQKDGLQVNGILGNGPKADLMLDGYKISSCDVGIRYGGAYGGGSVGRGSVAVCGDSVIIDNTLIAEANREIFFSPETVLDFATRCNVVIDQSIYALMRVNLPAGMWVSSSVSHAIWIKNANNAQVAINAYIYNLNNADGVRIEDASTFVTLDHPEFHKILGTGFAINPTVSTSNLKIIAPKYLNTPNTFNFANNRATSGLPFPLSIQGGRAVYWLNWNGTLDGSGNASVAHGQGGDFYRRAIHIMIGVKGSSGAYVYITPTFIDGTNINISAGAALANRPYNIMVLVGDINSTGW